MNLYRGIFNTSQYRPGTAPVSFGGTLYQRNPEAAPLLGMLSQRGVERADAAALHKWGIRRYFVVRPKVSAAAAAGTKGSVTNVSVDTTAGIRQGDVFLVTSTNEQVRVQQVNGPTTLALRRAFYQGQPAPIGAGVELLWVGNSVEEASLRPMASGGPATVGGYMYNFAQIFRHAHAVSGTVASTMLMSQELQGFGLPMIEGKDVLIGGKEETAYAHASAKERAILFSQPHQDTQNGMPIRTMGGLFWMISTYAPANVHTSATGTFNFSDLESALFPSIKYNYEGRQDAKTRVVIGGRRARRVVDQILRAQFDKPEMPMDMNGSYGAKFQNFDTFDGNFKVVEHPLFDTLPQLQSTLMAVDLNSMHVKYLPGRSAAYRGWGHKADGRSDDPGMNGSTAGELQASEMGIDARGGDFLSEMTMQVDAPDNFAIIRNVCMAGLEAPLVAVQNKTICIELDKPCTFGAVPAFSTVNLVFSGGNANMEIAVQFPASETAAGAVVPAGTATVTLDANGNGVFSYNVGAKGQFTLCVVANNSAANAAGVSFPATEYTACVQECLPTFDTDVSGIVSSETAANC